MALSEKEYPIMDIIRPIRFNKQKRVGRVYYYQGNFFYPMNLEDAEPGQVLKAIRIFRKENILLIVNDRKDPAYQTLVQLAGLNVA